LNAFHISGARELNVSFIGGGWRRLNQGHVIMSHHAHACEELQKLRPW